MNQYEFGGFPTEVCQTTKMDNCSLLPVLFISANIMLSINNIDLPQIAKIKKKASKLFIEQQDTQGAWDFYLKKEQSPHYMKELPEYNARFYFPDLDDSACISRFLSSNGFRFRENRELFQRTRQDGLYLTFLRDFQPPPPHRDYIDPIVNANVLLYLQSSDKHVCNYINESARDAKPSLYYHDWLIYYYMIGRAYAGGVRCLGASRTGILESLSARRQPDGSFGSALQTAAAINLLLYFEAQNQAELAQSVRSLLGMQRANGEWDSGFYFGGPILGYGSKALTTAMAAEALDHYLRTMPAK
jgi:hypothetical protein